MCSIAQQRGNRCSKMSKAIRIDSTTKPHATAALLFGPQRFQLPLDLEEAALRFLTLSDLGTMAECSKACSDTTSRFLHRTDKLVGRENNNDRFCVHALRLLAQPVSNLRPLLAHLSLRCSASEQESKFFQMAKPLLVQIITKFRQSFQQLDANVNTDHAISLALAACPRLTALDLFDGLFFDDTPQHDDNDAEGTAIGEALVSSGCSLRKLELYFSLPDRYTMQVLQTGA